VWTLLGGLVLAAGPIAQAAADSFALGLTGPVAILAFLTACVASAALRGVLRPLSPAAAAAGLGGVGLLAAAWLGVGGPSYPAVAYEAEAARRLAAGEPAAAHGNLRRAAELAPFSAAGWINLARALDPEIAGRPAAISAAERGLAALYLHDWGRRADALVLAGSLRLAARRGDEDWRRAEQSLAEALDLWRRSTRLPDEVGLVSLYNLAIVDLQRRNDRVAALIKLIEASGLEPQAARLAIDDPDLQALGWVLAPPPEAATAERLQERGAGWDTFASTARASGVPEEQTYRFLALILRCQARKAGAPTNCAL
jgi:hypothetical protein